MNAEEILIILEKAKDNLSYPDPIDQTQWAYNEGMEDLAIQIESLIKNKNDK